MERVGEHTVPAGPLAVRWLGYELPAFRAGAEAVAEVVLQNAGTATWRSRGELGVKLSYHWLDDRGNAIVWDGPRVDFGGPVPPGDEVEVELRVRAPQPPGPLPARVRPRRGAPLLVRRGRLPPARAGCRGAAPDRRAAARRRRPRRRRRGDDGGAGRAGGAARRGRTPSRPRTSSPARRPRPTGRAGSSTRTPRASSPSAARSRRRDRSLRPWAPGGGRNPAFSHPLLLPSLLAGLEPGEHEGLPAYVPDGRAGDLRRADQTSTATRSSTRLKTSAPSASEATAETTR